MAAPREYYSRQRSNRQVLCPRALIELSLNMLMLRHPWVLKRLAVSFLVAVGLLAFYSSYYQTHVLSPISLNDTIGSSQSEATPSTTTTLLAPSDSNPSRRRRRFAVFSCATPEKKSPQREYDYAFYLPLTVLAWQRIGFESLVLIVGDRSQWKGNPVLCHVLDALQSLSHDATVLFLPAKMENRVVLSQTARIFTANMDGYPGRSSDFILTSDSDLWPLRKQHFYQPEDTVDERPLMLFHSDCCRPFVFNGRSYKMQPMSHVGASAATWQEMVNESGAAAGGGNASVALPAKDSPSILDRLAQTFGQQVRHRVKYASGDWFVDQKFITLSIDRWLSRQQASPVSQVYKVSDVGFRRLDRLAWNVNKMTTSDLGQLYDAHLPVGGFQPAKWNSIRPLLRLMYGNASSTYHFCDDYAKRFYQLFKVK